MKPEIIFIEKYSIIISNKYRDRLISVNDVNISVKKSELENYRCHFAVLNNVSLDEIRFIYKSN